MLCPRLIPSPIDPPVEGKLARFEYPFIEGDSISKIGSLAVTPRFDKENYPQVQLRVSVPGRFRLASSSTFGQMVDGKFSFRVLVLGDHQISEDCKSAQIQLNSDSHTATVSCRQSGRLFFVNFETAKPIDGDVVATLGNAKLNFSIKEKP